MPDLTPADELRQAATTLRDTRNSIDVLLAARDLLATWLGSWDGFDIPADSPHAEDYRSAVEIARAINAKREGNHG